MKHLFYIFVLFAIVFDFWLLYPAVSEMQKSLFFDATFGVNEFGDMYGALNTLFSGLAFSGVIVSIFLQSAELRATRAEMKAQVVQFEHQTKAMQRQVFESSFFSMMDLHNTISSNLRNENKFKELFGGLIHIATKTHHYNRTLREHLDDIYNEFMAEAYAHVGHYFRYIYQIMKFIDRSELSKDERTVYMNILRAQLSNYELVLLFVNCQCYKRSDKFKELVESYGFFEHIYDSDLKEFLSGMNEFRIKDESGNNKYKYQLEELYMLYSPKAFGLKINENSKHT